MAGWYLLSTLSFIHSNTDIFSCVVKNLNSHIFQFVFSKDKMVTCSIKTPPMLPVSLFMSSTRPRPGHCPFGRNGWNPREPVGAVLPSRLFVLVVSKQHKNITVTSILTTQVEHLEKCMNSVRFRCVHCYSHRTTHTHCVYSHCINRDDL